MSRTAGIKLFLFFYLLVILVMTVVPYGEMNRSLNSILVLSLRADYLIHSLIFLPLVPLWILTFPKHRFFWVFMLGLGFAALAEYTHHFLPYRAFNINDLIFNMIGVFVGALMIMLVKAWRR